MYCGKPFSETSPPTIDHKIARIKNGDDSLENLQLLHHICNITKGKGEVVVAKPFGLEAIMPKQVRFSYAEGNMKTHLQAEKYKALWLALTKTKGNITEASKLLGTHRLQVYKFLRKYGLSKDTSEWVVVVEKT